MVAPSAPADSNPTDLASRRRRSASPVVDKAAARDAPKPVVLVPIAPIAPSREATPAAAVLSRAGTEEPPDEASDEVSRPAPALAPRPRPRRASSAHRAR